MEKDIIEIIKSKRFFELDSNEKIELQDYCANEDEFNQLKHAFMAVEATTFTTVKADPKTKQRLDDLFVQKYPQAAPIWYNSVLAVVIPKEKPIYKQPLMQIAAVVALLFLAIPFFNTGLEGDKNLVAENKIEQSEQDSLLEKEDVKLESEDVAEESESMNEQESTISSIPVERLEPASPTGWLEESEELVDENFPMIIEPSDTGSDVLVSSTLVSTEPPSSAAASDHPDGVFIGSAANDSDKLFSISVADSEDLMDLMVATF